MFPLYDSIKAGKFPFVTILIILITGYIFLQELLTPDTDAFIQHYALIPQLINFSNVSSLRTFITAIFLHGGWLHILSNMWFLWIFGDNVEAYVGRIQYVFLYIFAGIVGNLVQYLIMPHSSIPLIGASGAIAGVLGAYFVLFPYAKVKTLLFIFIFVTVFDVAAPIMLGYWFLLQLFSGAASFSAASSAGGVAFFAHIGGFLTGMLLAKVFSAGHALEGEVVTR